MTDDYIPPLSPDIVWAFKGNDYTPPLTPNIEWVFGANDEGGGGNELRKSTYMLILTM